MSDEPSAPVVAALSKEVPEVPVPPLPQPAKNAIQDRALYIFSRDNKFRIFVGKVVDHWLFDTFIFLVILLSLGVIAASDTFARRRGDSSVSWIAHVNIFVIAVFALEFVLKVIQLGLVLGPGAYFRSALNGVDFLVLVAGLVEVRSANLSALRALRTLRLVKSLHLRAASVRGMQALIAALVRGGRLILNVLLVFAFFLVFFAIVGLETLSSSMRRRCVWRSSGELFEPPDPEPITFCNYDWSNKGGLNCPSIDPDLTCLDIGYNSDFSELLNFDDIWHALFSVFQVTTLEGWSNYAYGLMDAEFVPVVAYFIVVIILCNFLVMNMAISVVCSVATAAWEMEDEVSLKVEAKAEARRASVVLAPAAPIAQGCCVRCCNATQRQATTLRGKWWFDLFFLFLIVANAAMLGYESPTAVDEGEYRVALLALDIAFTAAFAVEMIIAIIAERARFFRNWLNVIDFAVVVVACASIPFSAMLLLEGDNPTFSSSQLHSVKFLRTINVFRVVRVLRVAVRVPSMRKLLDTALQSSKNVASIIGISLIATVTYALIGREIFSARIPGTPDWIHDKYGFYDAVAANASDAVLQEIATLQANLGDPRINFDTLGSALLSLFIVSSTEQWDNALTNTLAASDNVRWFGPIYVITWFLISNFLLLQLFIAAILQQLEVAQEQRIQEQNRLFVEAWKNEVARRKALKILHKLAPQPSKGLKGLEQQSRRASIESVDSVASLPQGRVEYDESADILRVRPLFESMGGKPIEKEARACSSAPPPPKQWLRQGDPDHDVDMIMTHNNPTQQLQKGSRATVGIRADPEVMRKILMSPKKGGIKFFEDNTETDVASAIDKAENLSVADSSALVASSLAAPSLRRLPTVVDVSEHAQAADNAAAAIAGEFRHLTAHQQTVSANRPKRYIPRRRYCCIACAWFDDWIYSFQLLMAMKGWETPVGTDKALGLLGPRNPIRRACITIVDSWWFAWTMAAVIFASAIVLGMVDYNSLLTQPRWIQIADIIFTAIFLLEMLLKIVADGLISTPHAYLRSGWNWFDAFIAIMSLLEVCVSVGYGASQTLTTWGRFIRLGRTLRPLKLLERFEATRTLLNALWSGRWEILNSFLIMGIVFYAFAVAGRDLFGNRMGHCTDPAINTKADCKGVLIDDLGQPTLRYWEVPSANFDSLTNALSTLFEVSTVVSYIEPMWRAMDISSDGSKFTGPKYLDSASNSLFFVFFIFGCGYIILKLFVGIILVHLSKVRGTAWMTASQRQWDAIRKFIFSFAPGAERRLTRKINEEAAKQWVASLMSRAANKEFRLQQEAQALKAAKNAANARIRTISRADNPSTRTLSKASSFSGQQRLDDLPALKRTLSLTSQRTRKARRSSIITGPATRRGSLVALREKAIRSSMLDEDDFDASTTARMLAGNLSADLRQLRRAQHEVSFSTLRRLSISGLWEDFRGMRRVVLAECTDDVISPAESTLPKGSTALAPESERMTGPPASVNDEAHPGRERDNTTSPPKRSENRLLCVTHRRRCLGLACCCWCCAGGSGCRDLFCGRTKLGCMRLLVSACLSLQALLCCCTLRTPAAREDRPPPRTISGMQRMARSITWNPSGQSSRWWNWMTHFCFDIAVPCNETSSVCKKQGIRRFHLCHSRFDAIMMLIIVVNVILLMTTHYPASEAFHTYLSITNVVFLAIFSVEMIIKLMAYGVRRYLTDRWNAFDTFLVIFGWVMTYAQLPGGVQISRVLRTARIVRLLRRAPALRVVFTTLIVSLTSLLNTTVVVVLFMFVFAVIGVELYAPLNAERAGSSAWSQPLPNAADIFNITASTPANSSVFAAAVEFAAEHEPLTGFNRHVHFRNVGRAMLTLFRVLTGENWPDIYHDAWKYTSWAPLYWIGYNVVVVFILANFYLATVLEHFENTSALENGDITFSDLVRFKDIWKEFDPSDSGMIPFVMIRPFLMRFAMCGIWAKDLSSTSVGQLQSLMSFQGGDSAASPRPADAGSPRLATKHGRGPYSPGPQSLQTPDPQARHTMQQIDSARTASTSHTFSPRSPTEWNATAKELDQAEEEVDNALKERFVFSTTKNKYGRTPFMEYIAKGLYSRRWYGLVRAEVRAVSIQTFIQRFMVEHRREYKYSNLVDEVGTPRAVKSPSGIPAAERVYISRLRDNAIDAAYALPDRDLPVPFGKLLVTLCKWKLGSGVLPPDERLKRELKLTHYYSEWMASRVQALIRGYLLRRQYNMQRAGRSAAGDAAPADDNPENVKLQAPSKRLRPFRLASPPTLPPISSSRSAALDEVKASESQCRMLPESGVSATMAPTVATDAAVAGHSDSRDSITAVVGGVDDEEDSDARGLESVGMDRCHNIADQRTAARLDQSADSSILPALSEPERTPALEGIERMPVGPLRDRLRLAARRGEVSHSPAQRSRESMSTSYSRRSTTTTDDISIH